MVDRVDQGERTVAPVDAAGTADRSLEVKPGGGLDALSAQDTRPRQRPSDSWTAVVGQAGLEHGKRDGLTGHPFHVSSPRVGAPDGHTGPLSVDATMATSDP